VSVVECRAARIEIYDADTMKAISVTPDEYDDVWSRRDHLTRRDIQQRLPLDDNDG